MECAKEREIRWEIGFDSFGEAPLQISWNRRIRNNLYGFIPKLMGFSQTNWGFRQVVINWVMLWVHLSNWNYLVYRGRLGKLISFIYTNGYKISYKIVKNTGNIILYSLGTPGVGHQECKRFLKGHLTTVAFLLSPRRSYFMIITSPFALRPW